MDKTMILSTLPKTWLFDLDGTIVKHNGYKIDGTDSLLDGAKEYIDEIPAAVSINEAVEILKKYATKSDASYANGILSTVAKSI